ncbi:hypothetical protein H6G80_32630 [Nostoc sp. FACHB-87]|uniref:hypothetical protein n=1 Tax=Nostocaceae TaxID=1162 RepID=UPI0016832F57|nr:MULTISPECIES: hypothetical protein [Nostocaceae]MBD2458791.1 hypothetical protein [Nostoc sp. FACHB-87]MBD2480220.1 hypothetical protein [Anabaena sp. FACHB-83]
MLIVILLTVIVAEFTAAIFLFVGIWRLNSIKYGLLTFMWSFIVALLGAIAGFCLGYIWYKWELKTHPSYSNPDLNGLSSAGIGLGLFFVRLCFIQAGTILGAIWGGDRSLRYYQTRNKRT